MFSTIGKEENAIYHTHRRIYERHEFMAENVTGKRKQQVSMLLKNSLIERQMSQQAVGFERHADSSSRPDFSHMAASCQADATRATSGTKVRYKAGDVIVAADPFVFVLNPELRGQRCDHCLRKRSV